jgi:DNA-binding transcriptional ArsR family regulator
MFMNDSARFKVLADPHRQAIVERLAQGPATVVELTRTLGLSQPAVSHHLKLMRAAQLVRFAPSGASNVYHIDPEGLAAMRAWLDQHWTRALETYQTLVEKEPTDDDAH